MTSIHLLPHTLLLFYLRKNNIYVKEIQTKQSTAFIP